MPDVKDLLGHRNVALVEPGVGLVTLIQYHNGITHVEVLKVNQEVGPA